MAVLVPNNAPFSLSFFYTVDGLEHKSTIQTAAWSYSPPVVNPTPSTSWRREVGLGGIGSFTLDEYLGGFFDVLKQRYMSSVQLGRFQLVQNVAGMGAGVLVADSTVTDIRNGTAGGTYSRALQVTVSARSAPTTSGSTIDRRRGAKLVLLETNDGAPARIRVTEYQNVNALYNALVRGDTWLTRRGDPVTTPLWYTTTLNKKLRRSRKLV